MTAMTGIWTTILGGLVTLTVGWVLLHLEQGGRRRRLRRDIREEMELIAMLHEDSTVRKRLTARVNELLDRYEPASQPSTSNLRWFDWVAVLAALAALTAAILGALPTSSLWLSLLLGGAIGAVGAVALITIDIRRALTAQRRARYTAD